jgi:hypothetical protein
MKVYYLTNRDLAWDNVINIAVSPQKCIEAYTDGEIAPQTEEEVADYLKENRELYIGWTFLKE